MLATESYNDGAFNTYKLDIQGDRIKLLNDIYLALSRAVEEGDQLKIGIVLGQTLTKLEHIINGN
jgi:hypothetical protein